MYTDMDLYAKVRRAVMVDAMSERAATRNFSISPKTVNKMVNYTAPPGYQRKDRPVAPKLGAFVGIIDKVLQDDREVLKKQRHTAQRIFERLRDEHQYAGGYTVVREFVAKERLRQLEVFIPLAEAVATSNPSSIPHFAIEPASANPGSQHHRQPKLNR